MATTILRHPAVAGRFYPGDPDDLRTEARGYLSQARFINQAPVRAVGCIAPHAGYMYSGHVAGAVFARVEVPRRCIVMCPNHTGVGRALAIMSEGAWQTPLGDVPIDAELAGALKAAVPGAAGRFGSASRRACGRSGASISCCCGSRNSGSCPSLWATGQFEVLEQLGKALADVIAAQSDPVLIVASSDMNHYESDAVTRVKDHRAIERILTLDPRGLFDVVTQQDISMCGFGPAVAMLTAARQLGAKSAELVKYATSGDVSGDRDMVVGYAGVVVV